MLLESEEGSSNHFGEHFLISKSAVELRLALIAVACGPEKCVFTETFQK